MFTTPRIIYSVSLAVALLSGSAWAASSAIEGTVKDANGKLLSNADVKIEAKEGGSGNKMVKTNASGHYSCGGLAAPAIYRVSLLVNGSVKASLTNVKTTPSMPVQQLNFDLKKEAPAATSTSAKKKTHKVWVAGGTTGSNLGGHWVEVEDGETAGADANRVYQVKGSTIHP
jgi:hypothetical protein